MPSTETELAHLRERVKELEATVAIRERAISESARSIHKIMTRAVQAESRAARLQQQRDEAYERAANVAESFAPATQDMMSTTISDYCDSIAAAIRQLAATSDPKETTNG